MEINAVNSVGGSGLSPDVPQLQIEFSGSAVAFISKGNVGETVRIV